MNLPIGTILSDRYEILENIGKGGMAVVYRAKDRKLERYVTVKILRDDFSTGDDFEGKFKTEARAAASLSHPNIVNVYDVGSDGNINYIVMEYIHGDTLKKAISERAPFDTVTTLSISVQIAAAISAAHKHHIIHRDIKPQNILLSVDGTVKVTDFGIARAVNNSTVETTTNAAGSVHYFSPEQARGGYVDEKSDIYSLGITMYEMVTGHVPFDGETSVSIALKHITEKLPDMSMYNSNVPKSLEGIIKKATRKNPDERYANVSLMLDDIKLALKEYSENEPETGLEENGIKNKTVSVDTSMFRKNKTSGINENIKEPEVKQRADILDSFLKNDISKDSEVNRKERNKIKISKDDDFEDDFVDEEDYDDKKEKKVIIAAILTALIIISVITIFGMKFINGNDISNELVEVPSFIGENFETAEAKANELGIKLVKASEKTSDNFDEGTIISQTVDEGAKLEKDSQIDVTVSLGVPTYEMPYVINEKEDDAVEKIKDVLSVSIKVEEDYSDDIAAGYVMRQQPSEGIKITEDDTVVITVSKGVEDKKVTVPELEGKTESKARTEIENAGLTVGSVTYLESDKVEKGLVITQTIASGKEVAKNSVVGLVISSGKSETAEENDNNQENNNSSDSEDENGNVNDGGSADVVKTISFPVYAPANVSEGTTSVNVKVVKIGEGGSTEIVMNEKKELSEFPLNVSVSGSGTAEIQLYIDNTYQWSEKVNFAEGGN